MISTLRSAGRGRRPGLTKKLIFSGALTGLLLASLNLQGARGLLETLDGQKLEGDIRADGSSFVVTGTNGVRKVALDQLRLLRFLPEANQAPEADHPVHGLHGYYFQNIDLSGLVAYRLDPQVNFRWGAGEPVPGVGPNNFSVRWEGQVKAPGTGRFTFQTTSDAGMRLWVNQQLLVNQWTNAGRRKAEGSLDLQQDKKYELKLEYFDSAAAAAAIQLDWSGPNLPHGPVPTEKLYAPARAGLQAPPPAHGLLGLYFDEPDLSGPFLTRYDATVDFDWGEKPPRDGLGREKFSVRWVGHLTPQFGEEYIFRTVMDDCVRLWINDQLLIDGWTEEPSTLDSNPIRLTAGQPCAVRLEMANARGNSKAKWYWSSPSTPRALVPASRLRPGERPTGSITPPKKSIPVGVMLTGGSILARRAQQADDATVRFSESTKEPGLSAYHVARLVYQPLTAELETRIPRGRMGVLLPNKEFVESEFKGVQYGRVKMSSVLFGLKSYDLGQVAAVVLRDLQPAPARYELRARDGWLLRANSLRLEKNQFVSDDPALATVKIPAGDLSELKRSGQ